MLQVKPGRAHPIFRLLFAPRWKRKLAPPVIEQALLQAEAEHEQLKAARATGARFIPGIGLVFNPFLVLQVHRSNLLQETLAQVCTI